MLYFPTLSWILRHECAGVNMPFFHFKDKECYRFTMPLHEKQSHFNKLSRTINRRCGEKVTDIDIWETKNRTQNWDWKSAMKWYIIYFFKYHSAHTRKKNNKRGHVVLSTPFVPFVIWKTLATMLKIHPFLNFCKKSVIRPHTHFRKWGISPLDLYYADTSIGILCPYE
jgi:hypothetical protein